MKTTALLDLARAIMEQPTAPFYEEAVLGEIERRLTGLPGLTLQRDDFGNLLAHYQEGNARARYALAAHMDHPAYVGAEFLGGVPQSYLEKRPPTRSFGSYAMWDLPAFAVRDERIYSRACDDLIGCTAIVATLQELSASGAEASCYGLFTRAEEVGFVGAIQLAQSGLLPSEVTVISLETSSERGGPVKMGDGVIIRVGDRTSIFDSNATAELVALAAQAGIPYQRTLMSGGSCEATAYQLYGYRSAGLCVALGNYHNCGPEETIAPEYVSVADVEGLTRLCIAAARAGDLPSAEFILRQRLEENMAKYEKHFRPLQST